MTQAGDGAASPTPDEPADLTAQEQEPPAQRRQEIAAEIRAAAPLASYLPQITGLAGPETRIASAKARRAELDNTLHVIYAIGLLLLLLAVVGAADWVFLRYLEGNHWTVPGSTIDSWLGATVVQVIGIVVVVVRYLFPSQGSSTG